jgi:hypothetical protein
MSAGSDITSAYDLSTWHGADALQAESAVLADELAAALGEEADDYVTLRRELLPRMDQIRADVRAKDAGVYRVTAGQLARAQRALLCGGAAATGAYSRAHESPRLGVAQVGVCLTQYDGARSDGGWGMRLYRRNQPIAGDPKEQALALLEDQVRRQARDALGDEPDGGNVAELARRGIASFAERAVLLDRATAAWRFGAGQLAPLQLLTGGNGAALHHGVAMLRRFVETHPRFAFAATFDSEPAMEVIGGGLRAGEFALVKTDRQRLVSLVNGMSFRGGDRRLAEDFAEEVGPLITCGVYRVTAHARPQVFWAHRDHAQLAAIALMADAIQRPCTNRPLLLDLAQASAEAAFAGDGLGASVTAARVRSGRPFG